MSSVTRHPIDGATAAEADRATADLATPDLPDGSAGWPASEPDDRADGASARGRGRRGRLPGRVRWRWRRPAVFDAAICLLYAAFAFWLFQGLWPDPGTRAIAANPNDQALIEWFLAHGVLVWTGDFSLVTDRLNAPDGVNLMSNASHILHGVLMAPVTALFGAAVSFALLVAVNLAATAAGWYLLLARTLGLRRGAALVGGAVAGFAPGMISQSNSHLHMTAQWLVPPIVWCVIALTRATSTRATLGIAAALSGLVCAQVFLGEEVLYLTALTLAIFAGTYAARRREWLRQVAPRVGLGLGVTGIVSGAVLAYPLWVQFDGPQHTPNAPFGPEHFYADLASFAVFSPLSVAGSTEAGRLATSAAEYNTFLGLPLVLLVLGCVIWLRRSPVVVAAAVTTVVMALLSLGPNITIGGQRTGLPGLYSLVGGVPVISGALPTRYALALIPLIGIVLAYAVHAAVHTASRSGGGSSGSSSSGVARVLVPVAVLGALLPALPLPVATSARAPVPEFVAAGAWRECAPEGGVIVPVPLPTPLQPDPMRWPASANVAFAIPEGFFIGPYGPGGLSSIGTYPRPTSSMLAEINRTGAVPVINDDARAQARNDLAFWGADCVALAGVPNEQALLRALEQLLGAGTPIAGTWTWRVNA